MQLKMIFSFYFFFFLDICVPCDGNDFLKFKILQDYYCRIISVISGLFKEMQSSKKKKSTEKDFFIAIYILVRPNMFIHDGLIPYTVL